MKGILGAGLVALLTVASVAPSLAQARHHHHDGYDAYGSYGSARALGWPAGEPRYDSSGAPIEPSPGCSYGQALGDRC
jgi:hypothetical protein